MQVEKLPPSTVTGRIGDDIEAIYYITRTRGQANKDVDSPFKLKDAPAQDKLVKDLLNNKDNKHNSTTSKHAPTSNSTADTRATKGGKGTKGGSPPPKPDPKTTPTSPTRPNENDEQVRKRM